MNKYLLSIIGICLLSGCGADNEVEAASTSLQAPAESQIIDTTQDSNVHSIGGINAHLNGESFGWHVTGEKIGDVWHSQSDVTGAGQINIFGHVDWNTRSNDKDALVIGATVRESGAGYEVSNIEISFHKGGFGAGSYSTANDGNAAIEIVNMFNKDGLTRVIGSFSATLPYKKYASRDAELDNVVTIKRGRFNVRLPPLRR